MGCISQKTVIRNDNPKEKTQPSNQQQYSSQKQYPSHPHIPKNHNDIKQIRIEPVTKDESSHGSSRANYGILQKYVVSPKPSYYRTPTPHVYNYQSLIEFNPTRVSIHETERVSIEKTISKHQPDPHSKLLLTKQ